MDTVLFFGLICSNVVFFAHFLSQQTVAASSINFTKFTPESDFDGYRCKQSDTVFELKRSNLFSCSKACFENIYCYSIFYQPDYEDCIRCDGFYHTEEPLVGSKYVGRYSGSCYPGWTVGKSYCYYISAEKTDWVSAVGECKRMGGGLLDYSEADLFDEQEGVRYWTDLKYDPIRLKLYTSSGEIYAEDDYFFQTSTSEIACIYHNRMAVDYFIPTNCFLPFNFICKVADKYNQ